MCEILFASLLKKEDCVDCTAYKLGFYFLFFLPFFVFLFFKTGFFSVAQAVLELAL